MRTAMALLLLTASLVALRRADGNGASSHHASRRAQFKRVLEHLTQRGSGRTTSEREAMAEELLERLTAVEDDPELDLTSFQHSKGVPRLQRQEHHPSQHQSSISRDHGSQYDAQEHRHGTRHHNHNHHQKHTVHNHQHRYNSFEPSQDHRSHHSSASSYTAREVEVTHSEVNGGVGAGGGGGGGIGNNAARRDRREDEGGGGFRERQIFEVTGGHFSPRSSSHHAHHLSPPPLPPPLSPPLSPPSPLHSSSLHRRIMEKSSSSPSMFKWSSRSVSSENKDRNLEVSGPPSPQPRNHGLRFSSRTHVFPWPFEARPSPTPRYSAEDIMRMGAQFQQIPRRHLTSTTSSSGLLDGGDEALSVLQEPEETLTEVKDDVALEDDLDDDDENYDEEEEYEEEEESEEEEEELVMEEIDEIQRYLAMEEPLDERKVSRRNAKHSLTAEERQRKRERKRKRNREREEVNEDAVDEGPRLDHEYTNVHHDGDEYEDCCPSTLEVVQKMVGKKAKDNTAVEISPRQQLFYERVCEKKYLNNTCRFPARTIRKRAVTRCVQEYSYSQALVRKYQSNDSWDLDFILVRAGCSCKIMDTKKKKKKKKKRKKKKKKRVEMR